MLNIGCLVVNEDYDRLRLSIVENKLPHFTYTLTVSGAPEGGTSSTLKLYIIELVSSNLSIGFTLPPDKEIDKDLEIVFTTQPTADVKMPEDLKLICKIKEEITKSPILMKDILELFRKKPELVEINKNI